MGSLILTKVANLPKVGKYFPEAPAPNLTAAHPTACPLTATHPSYPPQLPCPEHLCDACCKERLVLVLDSVDRPSVQPDSATHRHGHDPPLAPLELVLHAHKAIKQGLELIRSEYRTSIHTVAVTLTVNKKLSLS